MNEGKAFLAGTEWLVESGMGMGTEIMNRYKNLTSNWPRWEKSHFSFAKYLDNQLESRCSALMNSGGGGDGNADVKRRTFLSRDEACQNYMKEAVMEYCQALKCGDKHLYMALPRLLTLFFEFTNLPEDMLESEATPVVTTGGRSRGE